MALLESSILFNPHQQGFRVSTMFSVINVILDIM
jgi:hypothetical protein